MSFFFAEGKKLVMQGGVDFRETGADLRLILVMALNTVYLAGPADGGQVVVANIAALDECNGANYARKAIAVQALAFSGANAVFSGTTPITYTALGAGSRANVAWILYKHVTSDADSPLLAWLNNAGFPFNGSGIDVPFSFPNGLVVQQ